MSSSNNIYYVYAYLRSKDSKTAKAGTPYYIGKGKNNRYKSKQHNVPVPTNLNYIRFLQTNLTEKESLLLEEFWIAVYGRIDLSKGVLRNKTDGGERNGNKVTWNKGIKYIDYYGPDKAAEVSRNMSATRVRKPQKEKITRKGKTYVEYYGEEKATEISQKISMSNIGREVADIHKKALSQRMSGANNIAKRADVRIKLREQKLGYKNSQSTISETVYREILTTLNTTDLKIRQISKMFNVTDGQVTRIKQYSIRMDT